MRVNKKTACALALLLGAAILTTSAFADVLLGSGYMGLKNAAKTTMSMLSDQMDSFTLETSMYIKLDEMVLGQEQSTIKYDMTKGAEESLSTRYSNGQNSEYYNYSDLEKSISKNMETNTYNVWEKQPYETERGIFRNPFEEDQAKDAERIVDAFVGNLTDLVQVLESDGKKMYTGNLSDAQVPPLLNAVTSYAAKYGIIENMERQESGLKLPKEEIYVVSASGKAVENENGMLEGIIGNINLSGKDEGGTQHTYYAEFSVELKDINATTVTMPNLEGEEVSYHASGNVFGEKYVGLYKSYIVKEESNSFVKLGERCLEITSVEKDFITGRYYEVYKDGDLGDEFEFTAESNKRFGEYVINYIDKDGVEKTGIINRGSGVQNIYVTLDVTIMENGYRHNGDYEEYFDSNFLRVFE